MFHTRKAVAALLLAVGSLIATTGGVPVGAAPAPAPASSTSGPNPVVIVSGLASPEIGHVLLKARLQADGFHATIFELPGGGTGDIAVTSEALIPVIDDVLATTGASQVDLIGHSEGGIVARYYINKLDGSDNVGRFISMAAPQHGTYAGNIAAFFGIGHFCLACEQMAIGSDFLNDLNSGPPVVGDIDVTTFRTIFDIAVRPVDNAKLDGAVNVLVQAQCPFRYVDHSGFAFDGAVYTGIRAALRDKPVRMNCWAL